MRLAFTVVFCLAAVAAAAQDEPERKPDFLFGAPRGYFGIRGGWHAASSSGSVYDFLEELLTIERGDFDGLVFGGEVGVAIGPRLDLVFGVDYSRAQMDSEFRKYTDPEGRPIQQHTNLDIVPVTASLKLYLSERGRAVSSYAYVPATIRPYVGVGGGVVVYELKQEGEFVDVDDLSIFEATLISTKAGLGGHVFGGIETRLTPRLSLGFEARYLWSHAGLEGDFADTEPIDLTGLRITGALNIAF